MSRPTSLRDVVMNLQSNLKADIYEFQVRRGRVLEDLLKETRRMQFHPHKRVTVRFYQVDYIPGTVLYLSAFYLR